MEMDPHKDYFLSLIDNRPSCRTIKGEIVLEISNRRRAAYFEITRPITL